MKALTIIGSILQTILVFGWMIEHVAHAGDFYGFTGVTAVVLHSLVDGSVALGVTIKIWMGNNW